MLTSCTPAIGINGQPPWARPEFKATGKSPFDYIGDSPDVATKLPKASEAPAAVAGLLTLGLEHKHAATVLGDERIAPRIARRELRRELRAELRPHLERRAPLALVLLELGRQRLLLLQRLPPLVQLALAHPPLVGDQGLELCELRLRGLLRRVGVCARGGGGRGGVREEGDRGGAEAGGRGAHRAT